MYSFPYVISSFTKTYTKRSAKKNFYLFLLSKNTMHTFILANLSVCGFKQITL